MTMLSRRVPGSETRLYQVTPRFRPKYLGLYMWYLLSSTKRESRPF